jgi:hypothetical protein
VSDFFPNVHPIAALKTRVWVAQARLGEALGWARERGLCAHDDLSYLREFEHIALARVLIARYKSDRADHSILEAMGLSFWPDKSFTNNTWQTSRCEIRSGSYCRWPVPAGVTIMAATWSNRR